MKNASKSPYDLKSIRKQASQHAIRNGAVTDDYPLDLKKVYQYLNEALATEIMCVLRYRHHQVIAKGIDCKEVAAEFEEHAIEESKHMMMIAERITQLGGDPDFRPSSVVKHTATEYGSSKNLLTLIEEDLIAERIVIMIYRKLITWFGDKDPTTRRMLESILADEEEHANDLSDLLHAN